MAQTWEWLLFAHWRVPFERLRAHVPSVLSLETFDGEAWLGITPFRLSGLRVEATPPLPALSTFPELNVRTYVSFGGRPGIYFFSLDAGSSFAVAAARRFYRLPYFLAEMAIEQAAAGTRFESARVDRRGHAASFQARYRRAGEPATAAPGSLEHFLTERYCLYAVEPGGATYRAEIHHPPWRLAPAAAEIAANTMPPPGLELPPQSPLFHLAERQDVLVWRLERARPPQV
jgi:uncharacterized protein YqjF (DUF2071 family)